MIDKYNVNDIWIDKNGDAYVISLRLPLDNVWHSRYTNKIDENGDNIIINDVQLSQDYIMISLDGNSRLVKLNVRQPGRFSNDEEEFLSCVYGDDFV